MRYAITGTLGSGELDGVYVAGGPPLVEDLGTVSGGTVPVEVDQGPQTIDVPFPVGTLGPTGYIIDATSLADFNEFILGGPGLGTVAINHAIAPIIVGNGFTVRYAVTGQFAPSGGAVTATFTAGTWKVKPTVGTTSTTSDASVGGATALGSVTGVGVTTFVGEGEALDITFAVPAGASIDPASITGFAGATLGGGGLGTVAFDQTYAPVLLSDGKTVEYRIAGSFGSGHVTATVTPGAFAFLNAAAAVTGSTLPTPLTVVQNSSLDIALTPTAGGTIDYAHLTLSSGDLTLSGPSVGSGLGTASVDPMAPIWLGGNRFRFFLDGAFTPGEVDVAFAAGSFSDSSGFSNAAASLTFTVLGPTGALVSPVSDSTVGANGLNGEGYLDVPFVAPAGSTIDPSTIANASSVFGISGAAGFSIDTTKAPVLVSQTGNTSVYRYWTIGAYTSGTVEITFINGGYSFVGGGTSTFIGPVAPVNFTVDGVATPNIHYLDVQLTPTGGDTLDLASIDDTAPELALSGAGAGTVALLADAMPTELPGTTIFRYYLSGSFAPGPVTVGFIAGSFSSSSAVHAAGFQNLAKTDGFDVQQLTATLADPNAGGMTGTDTLNGRSFIDVTFTLPAGAESIDASSVTDAAAEFSITSSGTLSLDTTQAPVLISQSSTAYVFRYFTTGTASSPITLSYVDGSVTFLDASDQPVVPTAGTYTVTGTYSGDTYIDVEFAAAANIPLDKTSIDGNEITLGGTGIGTAHLDSGQAPTILSGGVVRYYVSGQFAPGTVSVTFNAGSWQDTEGDPGLGGSAAFKLIDQVQNQGSGSTEERVFFIALSGGMNLQAGGIFGDTPDEPLLKITGAVELTIGTDPVTHLTRFELTASGTITVIKIGNIASGAADFVLQTGNSLSDLEFYGVAAIQTNFDFLQQYGVYLSGMALLEINTTSTTKAVTLSLAGVPGDGIFEVPNASYSSLVSSLPTDTFDEVALSSAWASLFASPTGGGATMPTSLLLDNGRSVSFASFGGLTLQNAQVEGVVAGQEWKIINGDGTEFFIQTETDQSGNPILVVSGEQRTYNLQPISFELEVVGGATVYDPSTLPGQSGSSCTLGEDPKTCATEWMHMDGGFLLRITATQTTIFFTAGGSIDPLGLSGRETGLLMISYDTRPSSTPGYVGIGLSAMFSLQIGVGIPPSGPSDDRGGLGDITGIFTFQGSVKVTLNTTLLDETFTVPQEFLAVLPNDFPSTITISAGAPEIDGSTSHSNSRGFYIQAVVTGTITLEDVITLSGVIGVTLQVGTPSFVRIQGAVSTNIPFLGSLSGSIDLGFYTSLPDGSGPAFNPGIVGLVTLSLNSSAIPGVTLSGHFLLEVNLFASYITTPGSPVQTVSFLTNADESLQTNPDGSIKTGPVTIPIGLQLVLAGSLTIASLVEIDGTFSFTFVPNPFLIQVTATGTVSFAGIGGLTFAGAFQLDAGGLTIYAHLTVGGNFGQSLGLSFSASADFEFSTESAPVTINFVNHTSKTIQPGFLLSINGEIDFVNIINASGSLTISITASAFTLDFNVDLTLGPLTLTASGFAGVYYDPTNNCQHCGLVLQLDVGINFNIFDIVKITGNGQIRLNTTGDDHVANGITIGAHSFKLHIDGTVSLLDVINLSTSVDVIVGGNQEVTYGTPGSYTYVDEVIGAGQWFFGFTGQANFFGLATLNALGWVDSYGHFGIDLNGGISIGGGGFGLSGNFDVSAWLSQQNCSASTTQYCNGANTGIYYTFGVHFSANVNVEAFGFSIAGAGISATISAAGTGTVDLVASVEVDIHILFFSFSATANFDIGTVQLPRPIFLAGAGTSTITGSATWTATTNAPADLYLNMGSRAEPVSGAFEGRGLAEDQINESFTIDHVSGVAGNETVQISAFGHQQTFAHVKNIYGYGGPGNDTIVVDQGVLAAVYLDGGDGYDTLLYDGSGGATLWADGNGTPGGDGDADVIIIGPDAGGPITIWGSSGGDYIVDNSSDPGVTINGGSGSDSITGGYGAGDVLNGGGGNDLIVSRGPSDHINGGAGDDTITMNLPTTAFPTIVGGGGNDTLAITGTIGADSVHITHPSGYDLGIVTSHGSLTATGIHTLDLNTGGGADTVTVDNMQDSSVTAMTIDVGANDHAADAVILNGSNTGDHFTLSGNDPNTGVQVVHTVNADPTWIEQIYVQHTVRSDGDTLRINGGNGADTIDASLLGTASTSSIPSTSPVDLVALTEFGGAGDDRLIGSPFNDVIDGGTSDSAGDTMTGGFGLDVFMSENPTAVDTLVETQNTDLGLYGNTFITGVVLANSGNQPYAQNAGNYLSETDLANTMQNTTNPSDVLRQPGYAERWAAGATVENIQGIFSTAVLTGGAGNNTMVVNAVDQQITIGGNARTVTTWNGDAVLDNGADTSGDNLPEYYVVTIMPGSSGGVDIVDSGGGSGTDDLVVFGSNQPDTLTLDAAGTGAYAVGFVQASVSSTEMISFQGVERFELYTLGGNDSVLSNDTAVTSLINLGAGDDSIVIGTVPLIPDPGNRTLEYPNGVPVADTAHMTNGNTAPLYVLGGTQNDYFEVDHNVGMLYLAGDEGDDTFLINTFLVLKQNPDKPDEVTNLTTLFGGTGSNRYEYLQNAPVAINGGSGYDTIIIEGTPIDDTFIITNTYIAGAGRIVNYTNVESIEVDGGGGNDSIYVLSTDPALTVTVNGGSGDDTIYIGGTAPPLVYDPPPFTYTPPAYHIVTPQLGHTTITDNYGAYFFGVSLFQWAALGGIGNATGAATMLLDNAFGIVAGGIVSATYTGLSIGYDWDPFDFGDLLPHVNVLFTGLQVSYTIPIITFVTRTIQPPPVTVTPAPVAIIAPPSVDASQVKSQVIILGGNDFETNGDTVVYNDAGGAVDNGQLVQRTVPRMVEVGEDPVTGTPQFVQDTLNGVGLTDTFLSLESTAIGISSTGAMSVETTPYFGVEMQGIEHVQLRLSNLGSTFTIDDTENCTSTPTHANPFAQSCVENSGPLAAPTVDVYGGTSNDTFNVRGIGAATTIMGGAGTDTINVQSTASNLSGILSRLSIDGNDMLTTQTTNVTATNSDPATNQLVNEFLLQSILVVGTNPVVVNGQTVYQANWVPILCQDNISALCNTSDPTGSIEVRSVVINGDGSLQQIDVQQKGVPTYGQQEYGFQKTTSIQLFLFSFVHGFQTVTISVPEWLDSSGNETTVNTGVPDIQLAPYGSAGAQPLYVDSQGNKTTVNTGAPVILAANTYSDGRPNMPVYVQPDFSQTFSQYGPNLLSDSDFSQSVPSNGSANGWTSANVDANGGWRSGDYFILNSNGAAATDPTISQTITSVLPGVTYTISGWFYNVYQQYGSNTTSTNSFGVYVNGSLIYAKPKSFSLNQGWVPFSVLWTDGNTATATLTLAGEQNGEDASYAVTDLSMQAINTPEYTTNFASGVNLWVDGSGRETATPTAFPSIVPIFNTHLQPFVRTADVISTTYNGQPLAGHDVLNIVDTGTVAAPITSNLTANVSTYTIPVDQLAAGKPVLNNDGLPSGTLNAAAKTYFGGEPVLDPLTGQQLSYMGGEPVVDLFTGQPVKDPNGVTLTHSAGDPMLHVAGDPVVQQRGTVVDFLGGEQVYDEQGNPVYTGSQPFTDQAGQAAISDRNQTVVDLEQQNGSLVAIGAGSFNAPSFTLATLAGAVLTVGGGATLLPTDKLAVIVYDGTDIYTLDPSHYAVNYGAGTVTIGGVTQHCDGTRTSCVTVKLVIQRAAVHGASDPQLYNGSEPVQVGQPILGAGNELQLDSHGNVVEYTAAQTTQTVGEAYYWIPTGGGIGTMSITLTQNASSITLSTFKIVVGTTTLTSADYTLMRIDAVAAPARERPRDRVADHDHVHGRGAALARRAGVLVHRQHVHAADLRARISRDHPRRRAGSPHRRRAGLLLERRSGAHRRAGEPPDDHRRGRRAAVRRHLLRPRLRHSLARQRQQQAHGEHDRPSGVDARHRRRRRTGHGYEPHRADDVQSRLRRRPGRGAVDRGRRHRQHRRRQRHGRRWQRGGLLADARRADGLQGQRQPDQGGPDHQRRRRQRHRHRRRHERPRATTWASSRPARSSASSTRRRLRRLRRLLEPRGAVIHLGNGGNTFAVQSTHGSPSVIATTYDRHGQRRRHRLGRLDRRPDDDHDRRRRRHDLRRQHHRAGPAEPVAQHARQHRRAADPRRRNGLQHAEHLRHR